MSTAERVFHFASYRLDLPNQQLWKRDEPIALRPKTFAVLRHLVESAGRLVTREELVRTVWPDTGGAERAPKRCILELRAALGDRTDAPQFIETVGRLGYRFIAPLAVPGRRDSRGRSPRLPAKSVASGRSPVGREYELEQLRDSLEEALAGERRVVFVTGGPGIGKTTIVEAFLDQARSGSAPLDDNGLLIGRGQCIEQYGEGEAYLPVLEALGRLGGENGVVRDLLWRSAPSWLAQLPSLVDEGELDTLQRRLHGSTRQRMLRELADFIGALTARVPLVIAIEDLHWSDYSTLDFVSSVTQRRDGARLLLIGTYRSTEIASDHPLRPVAQELLSHGQARELPLAGIGATAVEDYLDDRFPEHRLPPQFAHLLHRTTAGNPLFLINLVEDLVAQDLIAQVRGRWSLRASAESIAERVPENSRRLIEKQIGRVPAEAQSYLEAASVAGLEFTAEAVASALEASAEHVEERCDELVRQELFLRRLGADEWPDGTRTTRYAFSHAMYQQLWAERVPVQRQQRFHRRIGERREQSYGHRSGDIAAELAVHFDEGRDDARTVEYRHRAAQNALQRSAHREAIDHLTKGLDRLAKLPDSPERRQRELDLQILLGVPLVAIEGYGARGVERVYTRALELSEKVKETAQIVQALLGLWVFYAIRGRLRTARQLAERALRQSERLPLDELALDAHNALGTTLLWRGDLPAARAHLEQARALHGAQQQRAVVLHDVTDPGVGCLSTLAWTLWYLGFPDQSLAKSREALELAEGLAHPYSLGYALNFSAALHCCRRDVRPTEERGSATVALCQEHGFPFWLATGTILRSWAQVQQERDGRQLDEMRQGLGALEQIGAVLTRTAFLALLAESHGRRGEPAEGLRVLAEAQSLAEANDERLFEPEIERLGGELTLQLRHERLEAERHFLKAIELARSQQAKSWELRATTSLARLWRRQRKIAEARALLSEIYSWFTEGFDTPDLLEAKSLLGHLGGVPPAAGR